MKFALINIVMRIRKNLFFPQTKSGRICIANHLKSTENIYYRDKKKKLCDAENKIRSIVKMYLESSVFFISILRTLMCPDPLMQITQQWSS